MRAFSVLSVIRSKLEGIVIFVFTTSTLRMRMHIYMCAYVYMYIQNYICRCANGINIVNNTILRKYANRTRCCSIQKNEHPVSEKLSVHDTYVERWTWSGELAIKPSLTRLYFTHHHATLFLFVARVRLELNYVHSNLKQTKSVRKNTQRKKRHGSRLWMGRCECTYRRMWKDAKANGTGVIMRKGEGIAHWSRACFVISLSKEAIAENKRRMHASHACMHVCTQLRWPCTLLIITNDLISFHVCTSLTYSRDVCASY